MYRQLPLPSFEANKHEKKIKGERQNNPMAKSTRLKSTTYISSPLDN
jgi:hypothetical protein